MTNATTKAAKTTYTVRIEDEQGRFVWGYDVSTSTLEEAHSRAESTRRALEYRGETVGRVIVSPKAPVVSLPRAPRGDRARRAGGISAGAFMARLGSFNGPR